MEKPRLNFRKLLAQGHRRAAAALKPVLNGSGLPARTDCRSSRNVSGVMVVRRRLLRIGPI